MAIEFPFTADDKESNSSSGGDGKTKPSSTASNNVSSKTANSIFGEVDKTNSSSKASSPTATTVIDQTSSIDCELAKISPKANNCDASDVISNAIDTSGIKQEIKDDPDAPKVNKSVNNHQPALGGSLLPPHAANAKNPVSTPQSLLCLFSRIGEFKDGSKLLIGGRGKARSRSPASSSSLCVCQDESIKFNLVNAREM